MSDVCILHLPRLFRYPCVVVFFRPTFGLGYVDLILKLSVIATIDGQGSLDKLVRRLALHMKILEFLSGTTR